MKNLRLLWSYLIGKVNNPAKTEKVETKVKSKRKRINSEKEYEEWYALEVQKQEAILQCEGCKDEVFVLKKNGQDIGYYSNLNKLAVKNKFYAKSVYRYWKIYQPLGRKFKEIYDITKLN